MVFMTEQGQLEVTEFTSHFILGRGVASMRDSMRGKLEENVELCSCLASVAVPKIHLSLDLPFCIYYRKFQCFSFKFFHIKTHVFANIV